eukprot:1792611-Amphidinium_carterae.1
MQGSFSHHTNVTTTSQFGKETHKGGLNPGERRLNLVDRNFTVHKSDAIRQPHPVQYLVASQDTLELKLDVASESRPPDTRILVFIRPNM